MIRATLAAGLAVAALSFGGAAQTAPPKALPLDNLGLEHLDIVVPDPAAVGARSTHACSSPRCTSNPCATRCATSSCSAICRADRQVGYIAIGAAGARMPAIGHYCVLAKTYDRAAVAGALQSAGFGVAAAGPDRHVARSRSTRVAAVPASCGTGDCGGAVAAAHGARRVVLPRGVDHVLLRVSSLEKSLPYYRLVYGTAGEQPARFERARLVSAGAQHPAGPRGSGAGTGAGDRPLRDQGRTVRSQRGAGEAAGTRAPVCLRPTDEPDVVRFADNNGIVVEVKAGD